MKTATFLPGESVSNPKGNPYGLVRFTLGVIVLGLELFAYNLNARADQLEMQNGDHYIGKIISVSTNAVVFQNDVLGTVTLPRAKVTAMTSGATTTAPRAGIQAAASTVPASGNANAELSAAVRNINTNSVAIQQVKNQFLGDADPATQSKFDEMLNGLASGKMTISDLRVQAKSAADQLRSLKKELGPEADSSLDGYLTILDGFLRETVSSESASKTALPAKPAKAKKGDDEAD